MFVTTGLGVVGFIDDVMKLGERGHRGLSERGKLVLQFGISGFAMVWLVYGSAVPFNTELSFPFVSVERFTLGLPAIAYVLFTSFVIVGTSNAVNLTDGLDGLAIGPVILAAATFAVLAYVSATTFSYSTEVAGRTIWTSFDLAAYLRIPRVEGAVELAIFCASLMGASIGFLWFNAAPAQVFMGDVGALALGGALGTVAVLTKNELLSVVIHGLFVFETLSVIIQRYSYKWTGRRVFRMAPIHHHFQKVGWKEPKIVIRFWIVSLLLCLLALASLKLR
jgi:phospho-N-acetylmuramoyl-pentapeptide-transferase